MKDHPSQLIPEDLAALKAMSQAGRSQPRVAVEIRRNLVNLGLIELRLGNYVVTSRGHARVMRGK